jgi:thiol-disulfide isomerase/thioredoxin
MDNSLILGATMILLGAIALVIVFNGGYSYINKVLPGSKIVIDKPPLDDSGLDPNQARFMFFYTTWCPWCIKARTPWNSFKQLLKNNKYTYGGKEILIEEVNAESDKGKAALYRITGYPTFKLETENKVMEMKGKPSVAVFRAFLISALGEEKSVK